MDGRSHGIQMTPMGGDLNTSELSVGRALTGALPFFVPCGTFLIAHDAKCSRPNSLVRWVVQSRA